MPVQLSKDGAVVVVADADLIAGGDPDTTYTVRLMTKEGRKRLLVKHTKKVPGPNHVMVDRVDREAMVEDMVDEALADWTGILFDGAPVACERGYKLMLDEIRLTALLETAGLSKVIALEAAPREPFRPPA